VGKYFEVAPLLIQEALEAYTPSNNRSQLIRNENNTIIMDAYNANPTSMMLALSNFSGLIGERKCVILGDMLELGEASQAEHQKITDFVDIQAFEYVFLVGLQFKKTITGKEKKKFDTAELLSQYLKKHPLQHRFILVKGSRGIHLEKILELLT